MPTNGNENFVIQRQSNTRKKIPCKNNQGIVRFVLIADIFCIVLGFSLEDGADLREGQLLLYF